MPEGQEGSERLLPSSGCQCQCPAHGGTYFNNSKEEEEQLKHQFEAVAKLCSDRGHEDQGSDWRCWRTGGSDDVDGAMARTIHKVVLKRVISRLETDDNPMNVLPVIGQNYRKSARTKVEGIVDGINTKKTGEINYDEFKEFVQKMDHVDSSSE